MRSRFGISAGGSDGGVLGDSSSGSEGWGDTWYPNVPQQMWTDKGGNLLNMSSTWVQKGFGIPRDGCTLKDSWDAWLCPYRNYSRIVIENMDADNKIRRISPVALSADGYTDLLNGGMDHGWCMSYTCLKRLMTFWAVVKTETVTTVHFSATTPQSLRVHLPYALPQQKLILHIFYPGNMRLQIYVGKRIVEDVNRLDGKSKEQLVLDGRLSPNNDQGGYTPQTLSLIDACSIGDVESAIWKCSSASNEHGANCFNRNTGMLELVVGSHALEEFIEVKSMPVVAVSMGVQTSVADFYKIKDTFLSSLASTLGIDVTRITIVDVVAGNARRRHLLTESTTVNFEVEPSPVIQITSDDSITVLENIGIVSIEVTRSVNIVGGNCGVTLTVLELPGGGAVAGVNFVAKSVFVKFASKEEKKTVAIHVLSQPGYRPDAVKFSVALTSVENATLGEMQTATIALENVHMPPPSPPYLASTGTTTTGVMLAWNPATWHSAPSFPLNTTLNWEVECSRASGVWLPTIKVPANVLKQYLGGLETYSEVICRVRVEAQGWSSWSVSSTMYTLASCGNGIREGEEQCDDGNKNSADGCSGCLVDFGFACTKVAGGDVCSNGCRNGTKEESEACDDGNNLSGDGCDNKCEIERGWHCDARPHPTEADAVQSDCAVPCGDGIRLQVHEECDDGNRNDSDGCSANCSIETYAACIEDKSLKSVCQVCGNGLVEGTELCDDAHASSACLSCSSIQAGFFCVGIECFAGPSQVATPILDLAKEESVGCRWFAAADYGLPTVRYEIEIDVNGTSSWTSSSSWLRTITYVPPGGAQSFKYTLVNLTASTSYYVEIRACNQERCGEWSLRSNVLATLASVVSMNTIGSLMTEAAMIAAAATDMVVEAESFVVEKAPPPPGLAHHSF